MDGVLAGDDVADGGAGFLGRLGRLFGLGFGIVSRHGCGVLWMISLENSSKICSERLRKVMRDCDCYDGSDWDLVYILLWTAEQAEFGTVLDA